MSHRKTARKIPSLILNEYKPNENPKNIKSIAIIILKKQKLELNRLSLESEKLRKETELLGKHQLYRCCPSEVTE